MLAAGASPSRALVRRLRHPLCALLAATALLILNLAASFRWVPGTYSLDRALLVTAPLAVLAGALLRRLDWIPLLLPLVVVGGWLALTFATVHDLGGGDDGPAGPVLLAVVIYVCDVAALLLGSALVLLVTRAAHHARSHSAAQRD